MRPIGETAISAPTEPNKPPVRNRRQPSLEISLAPGLPCPNMRMTTDTPTRTSRAVPTNSATYRSGCSRAGGRGRPCRGLSLAGGEGAHSAGMIRHGWRRRSRMTQVPGRFLLGDRMYALKLTRWNNRDGKTDALCRQNPAPSLNQELIGFADWSDVPIQIVKTEGVHPAVLF